MTKKKTGYLFPQAERPSPKPTEKTPRKKSAAELALKTIQEAKDKNSRSNIIEKMAKSEEPWVCEVLIQSLSDPSEDIRDLIVTSLAERDDLDLGLLYSRLQKTHWYVKTGCLRVLGLKKIADSVKYISGLVDDPNIEVRRTLATVLSEIRGKEAVALLTKLSEDASCFVRTPAIQALQDISQVKFS